MAFDDPCSIIFVVWSEGLTFVIIAAVVADILLYDCVVSVCYYFVG